jgi:hypothetical protein
MTAAIVVGVGLAGRAVAEPRLGADRAELRRQLLDLQRRQRELDEKIRQLEAELENDRRAQTVVPRSTPAILMDAAPPSAAAQCMLPFYLDGDGIRHLRPECVEVANRSSCDPPYTLDRQGIRHLRAACTSGAAAPSRPAGE